MKVRGKLVLAQSPLLLALVLIGSVAVWTIHTLGGRAQVILKDNYRSVLAAERMKEALERLDSAALFYVTGRADLAGRQRAAHLLRFEAELQVEEGNLTERTEPEAARQLRQLWTAYKDQSAALLSRPDEPARLEYYFAVLHPAFLRLKDAADEILALNQDAMVRKSEAAGRLARGMVTGMVLATLLSCALSFFLSASWIGRVLHPLRVLTLAVRRLGAGDLEARAGLSAGLTAGPGPADPAAADEIALLSSEFNQLARHLSQYRRSSLGELLQAQQAAQAAIDSLPDPVVIFDIRGGLLNVNQAAESLLGLSVDPTAGDPLDPVEPALRTVLERLRAHVLAGKGSYQPRGFEESVRLGRADGERYLLPRATPVYAEGGGVSGAAVVLQDVTRLRRFDELKDDMVATVAHEFRTPLTSLRLAIHLCVEQAAGPISDKQGELLHAAREDCERLQSIVDELLTLARLQAGRLGEARGAAAVDVSPRRVAPAALVEAALESHHDLARGREVRLRAEVLPGLPEVLADADRIQLVLSNLLANALRHTPSGGEVVVRAQAEPRAARVRFEVADTGPGVPREHQAAIFERFYRVPGAPAGGAGLGLSIARDIVTAHGGEIGVDSVPPGATFWFTLPCAAGA